MPRSALAALTAVLAAAMGTLMPSTAAATAATPAATTVATLCPQLPGQLRCFAERGAVVAPPAAHGTVRPYATTATFGYGPADLQAAYAVPQSTTTATVAVVDAYDDPAVEANLAAYRNSYGLPPCTTANGCFRKVNLSGTAAPLPSYDPGWAGETNLDVQMVSAICPTCHILLVEAPDAGTSLVQAVQTATRLGARVVSMSWGSSEFAGQTQITDAYLSTRGVTYVAAAGDSGYGTSWPATSATVLAVGGTSLYADPTSTRGWRETAWSGSGSGCSAYVPRPAWQPSSACSRRAMNDLAVVADPNTGVRVYQNGTWQVFGGTSAGAPIIAALEAIAGAGPGGSVAVAYPYAHRAAFNDITTGTNGACATTVLCAAAAGWDGVTGVGSPHGVAGLAPPPGASWPQVTVRTPAPLTGYAGTAATVHLVATSSVPLPLRYTARGLPPGIAVRSTGDLTGVPRSAGSYRVSVTVDGASGASASTGFTWTVRRHRVVPSLTPHVAGTPARGHRVYASWGTFRRDTATGARVTPTVHVQWYLDGRAIRGATGTSYRIPWSWSYHGHRLSFRVTASVPYYLGYARTTALSARIR